VEKWEREGFLHPITAGSPIESNEADAMETLKEEGEKKKPIRFASAG